MLQKTVSVSADGTSTGTGSVSIVDEIDVVSEFCAGAGASTGVAGSRDMRDSVAGNSNNVEGVVTIQNLSNGAVSLYSLLAQETLRWAHDFCLSYISIPGISLCRGICS
jgi:hypothetical protein